MLKLCLQVSKGEDLWGLKTEKSDVLYLCLEDTFLRIQSRLFKITDCGSENFRVAVTSDKICSGLVEQLESYMNLHPNTKLIVIDTFQKVRNPNKDNSYVSDYGDISILKEFADRNNLAIIIVHHIRKQGDSDVFNKVSGTTGIMGSADTTFVLEKKARNSNNAMLYVTGRDVEYQELELEFKDCNWELVNRQTMEEIKQSKVPEVIYKVIDFMQDKEEWNGSSTELLNELHEENVPNNVITKLLNENYMEVLYEKGILFDTSRTKNGRLIKLKKKGDG